MRRFSPWEDYSAGARVTHAQSTARPRRIFCSARPAAAQACIVVSDSAAIGWSALSVAPLRNRTGTTDTGSLGRRRSGLRRPNDKRHGLQPVQHFDEVVQLHGARNVFEFGGEALGLDEAAVREIYDAVGEQAAEAGVGDDDRMAEIRKRMLLAVN